jgi:hypothetical protein
MGALATVGLSACGAPAYTYVADSSAQAYYKVPSQWHPITQKDMNAELKAAGGSGDGSWLTAFDASASPSADHNGSINLPQPFVFAQVGQLPQQEKDALSYDLMRDWWLPVTKSAQQQAAAEGFAGTNFTPLRDQTISGKQGVHGVRETFQYTFGKTTDTFDMEVLTNANQTELYTLQVHCTNACYSHDQGNINTIMSSFTIGSPT